MKIEIFSDFACPFCYIAKTKLFQAIKQLNLDEETEVVYRAFEINPAASKTETLSYVDSIFKKKNNDLRKTEDFMEALQMHAQDVGVVFNLDKIVLANTKNAHRLTKLAKLYEKELEFVDVVMEHYFSEGLNLNDTESLLAICEQIGIDRSMAQKIIKEEQFTEELVLDRYEAQQLQIKIIPFFVFEDHYGIRGVEPMEVFTNTLLQTKEYIKKNQK
ncbi:putative DsbA family dithiol-disulfide isomerase [Solibacillus kalamii]|uniref:Dithiol-disulfide isomerase n=1 Tax=Solibacillus kalamii TaxID=1748298 RepID=A0ABX3ZEQ6_9BACL|nr:DsbA family oxidoreductase [Solibacillus kalamii]MBM7667042.1 putative DsbA family dithiol-disulfide isomerase [Solibacillus kalamii]OUZ38190.1 dithiol-disulfide isomerase [Solibacillus kalamii]